MVEINEAERKKERRTRKKKTRKREKEGMRITAETSGTMLNAPTFES